MLQRYAPLPTDLMCNRSSVGLWVLRQFTLYCPRAVCRKPVTPIIEAGLQRTLGEKRSEAGTVDKEVALDALTIVEL